MLPTSKLYLLTANLQKSLKCYTPHAEVTFGMRALLWLSCSFSEHKISEFSVRCGLVYVDGQREVVSLTPPFSFSALGGNPGFESFVPAHYSLPFGTLNAILGSSSSKLAVMDILVPSPKKLLSSIELKTVVTEAIFGVMGAAVLQ